MALGQAKLFDNPKTVTSFGSAQTKSNPSAENDQGDKDLLRTISNIRYEAETYRDKFAPQWQEIEDQINIVPPSEWEDKDEWQTKIFIPLQFKVSETASAMMMELLGFTGRRQFFTVKGIDNDQDREQETELTRFINIILNEGGFFKHNGFVLQEAINIGTSLMKMIDSKTRTGIDFSFRSIIRGALDPQAIVDFEDSRYVMEWYNEDIADIMANEEYTKKGRDELLEHLQSKGPGKAKKTTLIGIANSEGNAEFQISEEYASVDIEEFWGFFPIREEVTVNGKVKVQYRNEWRAITVADEKVILRNDPNAYGFIPYQMCRTKRRRNHVYGNGFCLNIRGLQDLSNSLVNLGFDSAKIKSLGIVKVSEGDVADPNSIEFRPLAKWYMKPGKMDAASLEYLGEDNLKNIIKDISFADQLSQDASGVTRQFQGASPSFERQETLGQTQIKMAATEKRFMKIAQEVTEDYILGIPKKVFKIITHPKLVNKYQKLANEKIGMKTERININEGDPTLPPEFIVETTPKIDLKNLGQMHLDFEPIGIVNFQQKSELPEQMNNILTLMQNDPTMNLILAKERILKRLLQASDIPDLDDLFRNTDERTQMQDILSGVQEQLGGGEGGQI